MPILRTFCIRYGINFYNCNSLVSRLLAAFDIKHFVRLKCNTNLSIIWNVILDNFLHLLYIACALITNSVIKWIISVMMYCLKYVLMINSRNLHAIQPLFKIKQPLHFFLRCHRSNYSLLLYVKVKNKAWCTPLKHKVILLITLISFCNQRDAMNNLS
jgi:hypothetical protein